jgi:pyridoxal biosynthesis lyase PdxS
VVQAIGVDYIDESEVLTPADEAYHVDKWAFTVPFACGATNLGRRCAGSPRARHPDLPERHTAAPQIR